MKTSENIEQLSGALSSAQGLDRFHESEVFYKIKDTLTKKRHPKMTVFNRFISLVANEHI